MQMKVKTMNLGQPNNAHPESSTGFRSGGRLTHSLIPHFCITRAGPPTDSYQSLRRRISNICSAISP